MLQWYSATFYIFATLFVFELESSLLVFKTRVFIIFSNFFSVSRETNKLFLTIGD